MTIPALLEKRVKDDPKKPWIFFEDQQITYEDFDNTSNKLANGLSELGIGKGDKVIWLTTATSSHGHSANTY
jgi:acyl-CoA synthetase (AMP-forming)/AMP-acid ligase II